MHLLNLINDIIWTYICIGLLVFCALYFTIRLRGMQFTMIGEMLRMLFHKESPSVSPKEGGTAAGNGAAPADPGSQAKASKGSISPFQAFAVALSSRVGTGNLAGVASAIAIGGPGAVFWMWVMALLGSATAFVESTLAQLYKRRGDDAFYGGPAYYMQHGLHRRWMGVLFAVLITLTFGMANQLVQSNTLCDILSDTLTLDIRWVGAALTLMTLLVIFGGIQRISRFAALCVPFMAIGYLIISLVVIGLNISALPGVLRLIVSSAFGFEQAAGGMVGAAILQGVKRGLFSNEAGEGSAPNAAAIATTSHPVKQGLLQALGVFTDTLVICSCTAFIILLSGLYDNGSDGIILTTQALESEIGVAGRWFITAAIFLFAYSTIIANYFYGETNIRFILRAKSGESDASSRLPILAFRIISGVVILAGAFMTLQTAFTIVDIVMGLMTITNLIAIFLLFPRVHTLLRDYLAQRHAGRDPRFSKSIFDADTQRDITAWD